MIFSPGIQVLDDPLRPRGQRSKPFDGEGVATRRQSIIEDGRLTTWLMDSASARQLGMTSTGFRVPQTNIPRLSTNYAPVGGILLPIDPASTSIYLDQPAFPFGGAGLVSSAHDYDRFLAMLMNEGTLDGERVLAPETARLAMSNLLPEGIDTRGTFADGAGFGAGGRVSLPSSPDGEGTFGWGGAAGTIALVNSRRRLRFAGYANYMPSEAYDFQRRVAEVFLADLRAMVGA